MDRYSKNEKTLSPEENLSLRTKRVCIAGCGGLGGYITEMLGRLGVGYITLVDGDVFEESNLNRQLYSAPSLIGTSKAQAAADRLRLINPDVTVQMINEYIDQDNARQIIKGHDVVVDALDRKAPRLLLETACAELKIPLVHGAIGGWYGQVAVILPGRNLLHEIYEGMGEQGIETGLGNPAFTPAMVAAFQVSETIKLLIGKPSDLTNQIMFIDMLNLDLTVINKNQDRS